MANRIHPTAVIGDGVQLGDGNDIGPFAVLVGPLVIGSGNWIGPHCVIGTPASDRSAPHPAGWADEPSGDPERDGFGVRIGDGNTIREYSSVHQGTGRETMVGSDCYFLRSAHVAHDSQVGDGVTLGSNVVVGGHSEVWSLANLGLGVVVHQRGVIGPGAMVGMGAAVTREIGPFTISRGVPARVSGLNVVGLSRRGVSDEAIAALEPYVRQAEGELPAVGLPEEVSALLKEWDARRRAQRGNRGQD